MQKKSSQLMPMPTATVQPMRPQPQVSVMPIASQVPSMQRQSYMPPQAPAMQGMPNQQLSPMQKQQMVAALMPRQNPNMPTQMGQSDPRMPNFKPPTPNF